MKVRIYWLCRLCYLCSVFERKWYTYFLIDWHAISVGVDRCWMLISFFDCVLSIYVTGRCWPTLLFALMINGLFTELILLYLAILYAYVCMPTRTVFHRDENLLRSIDWWPSFSYGVSLWSSSASSLLMFRFAIRTL